MGMVGQIDAERRRGRGEAAKWFEILRRPRVSERALRDFHDWRGNPINAAAFEEIQSEWNGTIAILHHENRIARAAEALRRRRGVAPWPIASQYELAIGIVVILAALALGAIWTRDRPQQVVTGKSDNRQIVLSDGSRIRLDRDSGLSVTDTARLRRLVLDRGEAVVETAADGPRPFDFRAGPADLTANAPSSSCVAEPTAFT